MVHRQTVIEGLKATQSAEDALAHGINRKEWERLVGRLGREPNLVELGIYSVMWSEHCSYKSSRRHLAKFPTKNKYVLQGPGENAGVIDIGDGQAVVFKMESHNHPSFIEPREGAATGVGGILRDVFTMGARPIALVNALRFGSPEHPKTRSLLAGVVSGIGSYGNCVGVPTVAGETQFHKGYNGNILVNAMAVGVSDQDKIFYARGAIPNCPILYVGSMTGRDGIHGATMASAEFAEGDEEKRPTVQIGDPFTEKLLIEACLELMETDAIQAIQDMGAAGLTSSSVEMADKGGIGIEMNLDLVPQREEGMNAYEIMLSESQERMLMVLNPGKEDVAKEIFKKYDLNAEIIGTTTETGNLVLRQYGEVVCNIPVRPLADDAPNYDREWIEPPTRDSFDLSRFETQSSIADILIDLISSPDMCSKRWIWEQYDRHVMGDTIASSEKFGDAAIVRIHGTKKALAITSDCNPHFVSADPFEGGKQAVAEAFANLSAVGATPIAITDNLNFGNPERPEIMGQLVRAIDGMAEACRELDFPVVSGNVSLYNETDGIAIPPTPVVGGIGLINDIDKILPNNMARPGDTILLVGDSVGHLGTSLFAREFLKLEGEDLGSPPPVDLQSVLKNANFIRLVVQNQFANAVHDVSDGGVLCAMAEMALNSNVGLIVDVSRPNSELSIEDHRKNQLTFLFGENQGRYIVSASEEQLSNWTNNKDSKEPNTMVNYYEIGKVLPEQMITIYGNDSQDSLELATLRKEFEDWLPNYMSKGDKK